MSGAEIVSLRTMTWAAAGSAAALPLLAVPQQDDPLLLVTIHLALVVAFGAALGFRLAPAVDDSWFSGLPERAVLRRAVAGAWVVVAVAGAVGLVTLATSAALRYDPSLQFLQILSALDISWAAAAIVIGVRRRAGVAPALVAVAVLGVVCVWSIWRYLDAVGFGPGGSWIVDGAKLMRLVLPYDMAAAAAAAVLFAVGIRSDARVSAE